MSKLLDIHDKMLSELTKLEDPEIYAEGMHDTLDTKTIDNEQLEYVEKSYILLDAMIKRIQTTLSHTKAYKEKLCKASQKIRRLIHKEKPLSETNKFINVIPNMQMESTYSKNLYGSIRQYHSINEGQELATYTLTRAVQVVDKFTIDLPIIDELNQMKSAFYWYTGDKKNKEGIYMALMAGFYIQVPFPDLISKNSKNFKHKSIPCKYKTYLQCREKQTEYSKIYNTELRQCNFVHTGENFIKIGSDFRCPNLPSFGSHETLAEDMTTVTLPDIKNILMNASSDLLLILLWRLQHLNLGEIVFTNLDKL
jgi:hypothetical protein